ATPYPCALGTIAGGASRQVTTTLGVPAGYQGSGFANTVTVTASTADPVTANNAATLTTSIGCPALTLTPAVLPAAFLNVAYKQPFVVTNGVSPTTFSLSGRIPAGVSLSGAELSGTPREIGAFSLTVSAVDANGCRASVPYAWNVGRARFI